jgi:WD40 repeat protein
MFSQSPVINQSNPMKDIEVMSPPDDTISAMKFSPQTVLPKNFLLAGSWDCSVRCWEVADTGKQTFLSHPVHIISSRKIRFHHTKGDEDDDRSGPRCVLA